MMTEDILSEPDSAQTAFRDRQRPGCVDVLDAVDRELLPLMGGSALLEDVALFEDFAPRTEAPQSRETIAGSDFGGDQLPAARAIGFALILVLPFWAFVGLLAWKVMSMLG